MSSRRKKAAAAICIALLGSDESPAPKKRKWVKAISEARPQVGAQNSLLPILRLSDEDFRGYLRIATADFEELVSGIRSAVECQDTLMRAALTVEEQLTLTLRFLATGESFHSLHFQYCVGTSTVHNKVKNVCEALCNYLIPRYMRMPTTPAEWEEIAGRFLARWDFPHCIGALDGKHVQIRCPPKSGSSFFNYKGHHSIVLMALADADKKAIFVDVGANGRCNDSVTFRATGLFERLEKGECNLPQPTPLTGQTDPTGFVIVADAAFPMKEYMLRPYSQKELDTKENQVYNYRHSRARQCVEGFFGIMASRFRVLLTEINGLPENVTKIVLACCALHNFVSDKGQQQPSSQATQALKGLCKFGTKSSENARATRDKFKQYFVSQCGALPWQDKYLNAH